MHGPRAEVTSRDEIVRKLVEKYNTKVNAENVSRMKGVKWMDGDYSQFLAKLGAEVNGAEGENGAAKQDTADSAPSFSNSLEEFLMSHVAESGRLRPSGAACGKKGGIWAHAASAGTGTDG